MGPLRNAYLDALGIDRWVSRHAPAEVAAPVCPAATRGSHALAAPRPHQSGAAPVRAAAADATDWGVLRERVAACTACDLCKTRTQTVFGVGNTRAEWLVIGEAPAPKKTARVSPSSGGGSAAQRHAAGHRPAARAGVHRQHPQVPAAGQSRPEARRGVALPAVPSTQIALLQTEDHPRGRAHCGAEPARHRCAAGAPARQAAPLRRAHDAAGRSPITRPIYCARRPTSARPGKT